MKIKLFNEVHPKNGKNFPIEFLYTITSFKVNFQLIDFQIMAEDVQYLIVLEKIES